MFSLPFKNEGQHGREVASEMLMKENPDDLQKQFKDLPGFVSAPVAVPSTCNSSSVVWMGR